jgi:hypothetical protein
MVRLMLFFILALTAQAATPKIFSSVGDPVYAAVAPVKMLSTYKTFKQDRTLFTSFVTQADAARKEGFWLDKYRLLPEAKRRSKAYLETLRQLQQINAQISKIVKETTLNSIKKHRTKTYYALKKSAHPVFRDDKELRQQMARFERRLTQEHKQQQQENAEQKAAVLRSFKNLKGTWQGMVNKGESIVYNFKTPNDITITKQPETLLQAIEGRWRIHNDTLTISLKTITNQKADGIPHTRDTSVKLVKKILSIGKEHLTLFDTRRRKTTELKR